VNLENIGINDSNSHVTLIGFGFCRHIVPGTNVVISAGNPSYYSPEGVKR
jgi:hypothetical protein